MSNGNKSASRPSGFVSLAKVIPDASVDLKYYSYDNFVGERIDGYCANLALLTNEAATALCGVAERLGKQGYLLKIFDAYRPERAVRHFLRWTADVKDTRNKARFYPDVDKEHLIEKGYIADRSGHSRGSSVDLTLVSAHTGEELDMGGIFDFFGERSRPSCTEGLTEEQTRNRSLLRSAMTDGGFCPDNEEWWHFSLKNEPFPDTYFDFPIIDE